MVRAVQQRGRAGSRPRSYLVRFWPEPREGVEGGEIWRGYVRNLRTGEEQYLNGPEQLARFLGSCIRQRGADPEPGERPGVSTAGGGAD